METDVQVQVSGDVSGILSQLWQALYPAVVATIDAAVTPATIGAVFVAWSLTQGCKLWIEAFRPKMTRHEAKWRWSARAASGIAGALTGALFVLFGWLGHWGAVFVIAVINGPLWRAAVAIPLDWIRHPLTTQTDRKLMGIDP